ncbi:Leucine-rich repeat-containing protein 43 [Chytriomyces hyalinus]|nr:Leucine-rich repeat-containing protein 43 [Chytriomyces hyalinus]
MLKHTNIPSTHHAFKPSHVSLSAEFLAVLDSTTGIRPVNASNLSATRREKPRRQTNKASASAASKKLARKGNGAHAQKNDGGIHSSRAAESEDSEAVSQDWEIDLWAHANLDWSDEAPDLKAIHSKMRTDESNPAKKKNARVQDLTHDFVFGFFKSLRLVDKGICLVDEASKKFRNLKELSLTGNLIHEFDAQNLTQDLQVLHLNANKLLTCPDVSSLTSLLHLGIGFNSIDSILNFTPSKTLMSLDLSGNDLCNLVETANVLESIPNLQILALLRNPLYFIESYRKSIVAKLPKLTVLDDINVSVNERSSTATPSDQSPAVSPSPIVSEDILLLISLQEMTGLQAPTIEPPTDSRPPDEISFHFEASISAYSNNNSLFSCSEPVVWTPDLLDLASSVIVKLPITKMARDAFLGPITLKLFQCRYTHTPVLSGSALNLSATERPGTGNSAYSKAAVSRPVSPSKPAAAAAAPAKKGGATDKGKKLGAAGKGKKEEEVQYVKSVSLESEVAKAEISLRPLLDGSKTVQGDYHLERAASEDGASVVPTLVATLRASIKLHPSELERTGATKVYTL